MRLSALFIFLFCIFANLSAEDRTQVIPHSTTEGTRYSRDESSKHYMQGKEFYSQGRYQDARNEFEKALESVRPPAVGITEKARAIPETSLAPTMPAAVPLSKEELTKREQEKKRKKAKEEKAKEEKEEKGKKEEAAITKITEEGQYYIDAGDVLDISVWRIADLSRPEVIVRPDGKISFPLIGDIKAVNLTLTQLDETITEKLKAYVKAPEVSVMIRRFGEQANKVSILGEVTAPGVYRFSSAPTITEAVASAGGYTKYSVINSIMVIRGVGMGKKPEAIRINLAHILKGNKYSNNIWLKPNDIIYVPRSFIGNVNTFMELIQPAISEYMQTMDARRFHNVMHRN